MEKPSKGQIAGFAALGLLVALTAVAFYSSRQSRASAPTAEVPADLTATPPEPQPAPRVTDRLPGKHGSASPEEHGKGATITAVAEDIMLTPQARLLAERLMCVCGCNDILAVCTCTQTPGSRDMKKYLQELVNQGKNPAEVESAMVARYGEAVRP